MLRINATHHHALSTYEFAMQTSATVNASDVPVEIVGCEQNPDEVAIVVTTEVGRSVHRVSTKRLVECVNKASNPSDFWCGPVLIPTPKDGIVSGDGGGAV